MSAHTPQEMFAAAANALFDGDSDKAAALMAEGAVAAAPHVNVDELAEAVERRAATTSAARQMLADHPEIAADPDMIFLADRAVDLKMRGGMAAEAAIAEAGIEISERFKLGRFKETQATRRPRGGNRVATAEEDPQRAVALEGLAYLQSTRHGNPSSS